jgi:hypothetical protein
VPKIVHPEVSALDEIVRILEPLDLMARDRILDYAKRLFLDPAPLPRPNCNFPGYAHVPAQQGMAAPSASVTFERLPPDQMVPGPNNQAVGGHGVSVEPLDGPG